MVDISVEEGIFGKKSPTSKFILLNQQSVARIAYVTSIKMYAT